MRAFLSSADCFQNQLFRNVLTGIPPECQTVWIQIRPDNNVGPDLDLNCLQMFSADYTSRRELLILLDFSLTVKAATLIFISGCGSAFSSAKEGKSGFIYNFVKS